MVAAVAVAVVVAVALHQHVLQHVAVCFRSEAQDVSADRARESQKVEATPELINSVHAKDAPVLPSFCGELRCKITRMPTKPLTRLLVRKTNSWVIQINIDLN